MNGEKIARDYAAQASARLKALDVLQAEGRYDAVHREGQEILELIAKGLLRHIGIDPPKRHDCADLLLEHVGRLPDAWRGILEEFVALSARLFEERGAAFYGDEEDLVPSSELFGRARAEEVLAAVRRFVGAYAAVFDPADRS